MQNRKDAILSQFSDSWVETERYFDDLIDNYPGFERLKPIRLFIRELKRTGENRFF